MKIILFLLAFMPAALFAESSPIVLTKDNTISLRDSVNWSSMSQLQFDLLQKANNLDNNEPIYLILDTPGGSVSAGEMFIETLKGVKQPVHTIVIFAASMGFQITQATDTRFILGSGTLMSHRATVGLRGQMDGELESRLAYYKKAVGAMELRSAIRVGLNIADYKNKILNEWWEIGINAVNAKLADKVVTVKCSEKLARGTETKTVVSFFGKRTLKFSTCPLITTPIINTKKSFNDFVNTETFTPLDTYINLLFFDKRNFVNNYINTGMFNY